MIPFHRFLIATAILFCVGFAAWAFVAYRSGGGALQLGLGVVFTIAGLALAYYLKNLNRFLHR
jgi:uncharacterized membrane protein YdjX (TVP38/TMEM64 family)